MTTLLTPEQVAEELGISVDRVKRRTTSEGWPHVRLSAKAIRYRTEHVEQIIARFEVDASPVTGIAGQTPRSRRRSA